MILPAIHFPGNCLEAITFYEAVFQVTDKRILFDRDAPRSPDSPSAEAMGDRITHAEMMINGSKVSMCDTPEQVVPGNMIVLNVLMDTPEAVTQAYHKLEQGGQVMMPLGPQFFSPMYGAVKDRFGVEWQLIAQFPPKA